MDAESVVAGRVGWWAKVDFRKNCIRIRDSALYFPIKKLSGAILSR